MRHIPTFDQYLNESIEFAEFKKVFRKDYGHISPNLTDREIQAYVNKPENKNLDVNQLAAHFADYILANDLGEVQESDLDNAYDQHDELLDIILKYVKNPDEAERFASMDPEKWPDSLRAQLDHDDEYQELIDSEK